MQNYDFSESDSQAKELEEYRALSPVALITLVLGLASVLAVGSPSFWVIPALAVGCAIWAFRDLRRNSASRFGRKAALAGLLLALFFGGFASTRVLGDRILHLQEARRVVEQWFQAIRDQHPREAFRLMMDSHARPTDREGMGHFLAADASLQVRMDETFGGPVYRELIDAAPDFDARYVLRELDARSRQGRILQLRYDVHWDGEVKPPTPLVVDLRLEPGPSVLARRDRWEVRGVRAVGSP